MGNETETKRLSNSEANRLSRESICTALILLMDTEDFDNITISGLVKKAGVSRQTFYRNYASKEDVVIEIEESLLTMFSDSLHDPKYEGNIRAWFADLFGFVRKNKKMISVLYRANLFDMLFTKAPFVIEEFMRTNEIRTHYLIVGSLGALRAIGDRWFAGGMKESDDEMADICMAYDLEKGFRNSLPEDDLGQ